MRGLFFGPDVYCGRPGGVTWMVGPFGRCHGYDAHAEAHHEKEECEPSSAMCLFFPATTCLGVGSVTVGICTVKWTLHFGKVIPCPSRDCKTSRVVTAAMPSSGVLPVSCQALRQGSLMLFSMVMFRLLPQILRSEVLSKEAHSENSNSQQKISFQNPIEGHSQLLLFTLLVPPAIGSV